MSMQCLFVLVTLSTSGNTVGVILNSYMGNDEYWFINLVHRLFAFWKLENKTWKYKVEIYVEGINRNTTFKINIPNSKYEFVKLENTTQVGLCFQLELKLQQPKSKSTVILKPNKNITNQHWNHVESTTELCRLVCEHDSGKAACSKKIVDTVQRLPNPVHSSWICAIIDVWYGISRVGNLARGNSLNSTYVV